MMARRSSVSRRTRPQVIPCRQESFQGEASRSLPFLDYSTLEKRRQACEAELRINLPLASEVYRRVLPITRATDGALALDGGGTPVEWAVEMRRFDENATFDHLAAAGRIDSELADALGQAVVAAAKCVAAPDVAQR